jgi:hypothetical protein
LRRVDSRGAIGLLSDSKLRPIAAKLYSNQKALSPPAVAMLSQIGAVSGVEEGSIAPLIAGPPYLK